MSLRIYAVIYLIFLYLPVVLLPLFAFNASAIVAFPLQGFSIEWFAELTRVSALHDATRNSVSIALVTAICSTLFGTFVARANARFHYMGKRGLTALVMLPLVLPEIVVGVSLLVVMVHGLGWALASWSIIVAHILICTPFAAVIMRTSFTNLDPALEEAAIDLGASNFAVFRLVILPLVLPGIISSLLITFTISLDEFIIAFFLSGAEPTLPVYIWGLLRFPQKLPVVMALGTLLISLSVLLVVIAEVFRRKGLTRAGINGQPIP